ncbi:MAG: segregation/condensation protein A [Deltaproteobacteria bacterium]|nr:segregation/condensation protein A [Deltaproteobacteria bacterium]MDX9762223.1 ScpA family protein [Desulfomonilia bacterium]HPW69673.1 ScpA family protein [Deltaproteobacteria bacterium]
MLSAAVEYPAPEFILRLPEFEGPLDLLLYLIEKNRFTLENLEVCPVVDQYLQYVEQARSLDVSLAGEFLETASYLVWLKSCLLLPASGEEGGGEDFNPARELKEMLIAYRAIRQAALEFSGRPLLLRDKFPRGLSREERGVSPLSIGALLQAVNAIRDRTRKYVMEVVASRLDIQTMIARIEGILRGRPRVALQDVVETEERMELIGAFAASLELSKRSIVRLVQRGLFAAIYLVRR